MGSDAGKNRRDRSMLRRRFAIGFLLGQAAAAAAWWCLLLVQPSFRVPFMAKGAPDATQMAFLTPDAILFILSSAVAAIGLWARKPWAWPLLCVHSGAAGYAALYSWSLTVLTAGDGLLGALLMSPSLVVPGVLVWWFHPQGGAKE
jgi:hypothetical protein